MTIYDFPVTTIDGTEQTLAPWRGQTLLIVNVASQCGFTPQYAGLEAMYRRLRKRKFAVLGFPCDQFGHQEPGDAEEIKRFCQTSYDVTFPLFAKIEVNGPGAHPLYQYLRSAQTGIFGTEAIKWNFTKFLVGPAGEVLHRYAPTDSPEMIEREIEPLLI